MATADRGFASMEPNKRREIASKGGRAAHRKGTAHEWTQEEACAAGRKGGIATSRRTHPEDVEQETDGCSSHDDRMRIECSPIHAGNV